MKKISLRSPAEGEGHEGFPPPPDKDGRPSNRWGTQPWALYLPDKELCLWEALAVCTPQAPEPSAKRPGSYENLCASFRLSWEVGAPNICIIGLSLMGALCAGHLAEPLITWG